MAIESYWGIEGVCFTVESEHDVYEVLDTLHSMAMEAFPHNSEIVTWLSKVVMEAQEKYQDEHS